LKQHLQELPRALATLRYEAAEAERLISKRKSSEESDSRYRGSYRDTAAQIAGI
jgi:hypothetical protein